jgi:hypothetical protein
LPFVTPEFAAALLKDPRLDAEIARRRRLREQQEERRWLEEDPSGILAGINRLTRAIKQAIAELDKPRPPGTREPDPEERERQREEWSEFEDRCYGLIEGVERLIAREEDEAAGIERRCTRTAKVRCRPITPKPPPPPPKAKQRSQQPANGASRSAPSPGSAQTSPLQDGGWCNGVIRYFNAVTRLGIVIVNGLTEMSLPSAVFAKSGLTVLSPNQHVKVRVVTHPDRRNEIDALELRMSSEEPGAASAQAVGGRFRINPVREKYAGW